MGSIHELSRPRLTACNSRCYSGWGSGSSSYNSCQLLLTAFQVHPSQQGGVQQRGLLLLVQVRTGWHIRLLLEGHKPRHLQQGVHQRVVLTAVVDLCAEGLDEPGAGLAAAERVVVPERGLEYEKVGVVGYLVGWGRVLAGVATPHLDTRIGILKYNIIPIIKTHFEHVLHL